MGSPPAVVLRRCTEGNMAFPTSAVRFRLRNLRTALSEMQVLSVGPRFVCVTSMTLTTTRRARYAKGTVREGHGTLGPTSMDDPKLEEYRRAVDELQQAVKQLRVSADWDAAHAEYMKAKERCDKARAALAEE